MLYLVCQLGRYISFLHPIKNSESNSTWFGQNLEVSFVKLHAVNVEVSWIINLFCIWVGLKCLAIMLSILIGRPTSNSLEFWISLNLPNNTVGLNYLWEIDAPPPEALWICNMPRDAMVRLRPKSVLFPVQPHIIQNLKLALTVQTLQIWMCFFQTVCYWN